jgi:hypothetical protein
MCDKIILERNVCCVINEWFARGTMLKKNDNPKLEYEVKYGVQVIDKNKKIIYKAKEWCLLGCYAVWIL